jgi:hypothetical protein
MLSCAKQSAAYTAAASRGSQSCKTTAAVQQQQRVSKAPLMDTPRTHSAAAGSTTPPCTAPRLRRRRRCTSETPKCTRRASNQRADARHAVHKTRTSAGPRTAAGLTHSRLGGRSAPAQKHAAWCAHAASHSGCVWLGARKRRCTCWATARPRRSQANCAPGDLPTTQGVGRAPTWPRVKEHVASRNTWQRPQADTHAAEQRGCPPSLLGTINPDDVAGALGAGGCLYRTPPGLQRHAAVSDTCTP